MVTVLRSATCTTRFLLLSLKISLASACLPFASASFTPLKAVSSPKVRPLSTVKTRKVGIAFFMLFLQDGELWCLLRKVGQVQVCRFEIAISRTKTPLPRLLAALLCENDVELRCQRNWLA